MQRRLRQNMLGIRQGDRTPPGGTGMPVKPAHDRIDQHEILAGIVFDPTARQQVLFNQGKGKADAQRNVMTGRRKVAKRHAIMRLNRDIKHRTLLFFQPLHFAILLFDFYFMPCKSS